MTTTDKGRHLYRIKKSIAHWPWTSHKMRSIETGLAKLRIGHVGLMSHLARFNMSDTHLCPCNNTETVEHFLMQCPLYEDIRTEMYLKLNSLNVPMNIRNVLGGGEYNIHKQKKIQDAIASFLINSGRLGML